MLIAISNGQLQIEYRWPRDDLGARELGAILLDVGLARSNLDLG